MKYGYMKTAAVTPKIRVADCEYNAGQICSGLKEAADLGAELTVFPELCLTGYTCGDLFGQNTLLEGAKEGLRRILSESRDRNTVGVVGIPVVYQSKLYNCAAVFSKGRLLGFVPKENLPNYGEFYEARQFTPAPRGNGEIFWDGEAVPFGTDLLFCCREMPDFVFAVEICEDLWVPAPPSQRHTAAGALIVVNSSASDETIGKNDYRRQLVGGQSARLVCGYVYCDAGDGESTTDMVFSGHNLIAENGTVLAESSLFQNGILLSEIDVQKLAAERRRMSTYPAGNDGSYRRIAFSLEERECVLTRSISSTPFIPTESAERNSRCESILEIQAAGLAKRIEHSHCKTAVIGISGGLDSCLALLASVRAMDRLQRDRKDIIAVTMPCFGTTDRTRNNAWELSRMLGVTLREIRIGASVTQHFADIGHDIGVHDVTYENGQARERTQVLMDIANQENGLVVGTGDLSELALGWATYNGDHMSMYGVNASIPKTLVKHIVRYEADRADPELKRVLLDILDTPVSPELLPANEQEITQKTEDLVGPYLLHDFFLYYAIRWGFSPKKIFFLAQHSFRGEFEDEVILKWETVFFRRFFIQQFKRSCLPDGPKVGSVTLSPRGDWRMPSDACSALWLRELEELKK